MTPRTEMFILKHDEKLDNKTIAKIKSYGHSRIPVFKENRDEIVGILYVKDLIGGIWDSKKAEELIRKDVIYVDQSKKLDDLLNDFKKTRCHLFLVLTEFGGVAGIVTIEDVLEEIIGVEIIDEYDKHADLQKIAKSKMKKKNLHKV